MRLATIFFLHPRRGRGREGRDRDVEKFLDPAKAAVFGPKIVSPLRNAVRLVDHDIIGPAGGQRRHERFIAESFRRDVEETQTPGSPVLHRLLSLAKGNMTVQHGRRDAGELELLDLVVHQADQGRHDQAVLFGSARRETGSTSDFPLPVAMTPSKIAAALQGVDQLFLARVKCVMAKSRFQESTFHERGPTVSVSGADSSFFTTNQGGDQTFMRDVPMWVRLSGSGRGLLEQDHAGLERN